MEIRKVPGGWEYDGIVFVKKSDAIETKKLTEHAEPQTPKPLRVSDIEVIYDSEHSTTFGTFLDEVLKEGNRSLIGLAKDIGVTRQALFSWLTGESLPSPKHTARIMKATRSDQDRVMAALKDNFQRRDEKYQHDVQKLAKKTRSVAGY